MSVCFEKGQASQEVISTLNLTASSQGNQLCVADAPAALEELADDRGVVSLQTADRLQKTITKIGKDKFAQLIQAESCWMTPGQRRFFMQKQVLGGPQAMGHGDTGVSAKCPFEESVPEAMGHVLFSVSQMPSTIRDQVAPAVVRLDNFMDPFVAGRGVGSAVIVSPEGHVLTARHVVGSDRSDEERAAGETRTLWEDFKPVLLESPRGDSLLLDESHVVRRFPQRDLALLKVPQLAGHPYIPLLPHERASGDPQFVLGYQTWTHDLQEIGAECESYEKSLYDDCLWLGGREFLRNQGGLYAAAGEPRSMSQKDQNRYGPHYFASSGYVRRGMSGGPIVVLHDGKPHVVGITSAGGNYSREETLHRFSLPPMKGAILSRRELFDGLIGVKVDQEVQDALIGE